MKLRSGNVTTRGRSSLGSTGSARNKPSARSRHNETLCQKTTQIVTGRHLDLPKTQQQVFSLKSSKESLDIQNVRSENFGSFSSENGVTHNEIESKQVKKRSTSSLSLLVVLLIIVFLLLPAWSWFTWTKSDPVEIYAEGLKNLSVSFPEQSLRLWNILRVRGLTHLNTSAPPRPLVFMLAGPPDAHEAVSCLALKLAGMIDSQNEEQLLIINGAEHSANQGDNTKIELDKLLTNHFKTGHKVAIIKELEALPATSPLLFYSYCDDQNAPYKDIALIFTIHLRQYPDSSLSPMEAEGTVEKYLAKEVWRSPQYEQNAVAALLSRVADTVVLVHPEKKSVVERVCP